MNRGGAGGSADFDGRRLMIHLLKGAPNLSAFELDVEFDADKSQWKGFWSLCGRPEGVVIERPRPPMAAARNAFIGDWETLPDATHPRGALHVRQSADGQLMV